MRFVSDDGDGVFAWRVFPWNLCWKFGPLNVAGLPATMLAHDFESGVNSMVTELRWLILWILWVMLMESACVSVFMVRF